MLRLKFELKEGVNNKCWKWTFKANGGECTMKKKSICNGEKNKSKMDVQNWAGVITAQFWIKEVLCRMLEREFRVN